MTGGREEKLQEGRSPVSSSCLPLGASCSPPAISAALPSRWAPQSWSSALHSLPVHGQKPGPATQALATRMDGPFGLIPFSSQLSSERKQRAAVLLTGLPPAQQTRHPFPMVGNVISHTLTKTKLK